MSGFIPDLPSLTFVAVDHTANGNLKP